MDEFQIKSRSQQKVESIADMKNFVETYPQFKVFETQFTGLFILKGSKIFKKILICRKCRAL